MRWTFLHWESTPCNGKQTPAPVKNRSIAPSILFVWICRQLATLSSSVIRGLWYSEPSQCGLWELLGNHVWGDVHSSMRKWAHWSSYSHLWGWGLLDIRRQLHPRCVFAFSPSNLIGPHLAQVFPQIFVTRSYRVLGWDTNGNAALS